MTIENHAGVYFQEVDQSQVVETAAANGVGSVIVSERGPLDVTVVNTPSQFIQKFGQINIGKFGLTGVQALMDTEATSLSYIKRVVPDDCKYSTIMYTIEPTSADPVVIQKDGWVQAQYDTPTFAGVNQLMVISVKNPGFWGDNVGFKVSDYDKSAPGFFTIEVYEKSGGFPIKVETFQDVSWKEDAVNGFGNIAYMQEVVNNSSEYIQIFMNPNFDYDLIGGLSNQQLAALMDHFFNLETCGGGADGDLSVANMLPKIVAGYDAFSDVDTVNVSYVVDGAQGQLVQQKTLALVKQRQDALAIHSNGVGRSKVTQIVADRSAQNINDNYGIFCAGDIKCRSAFDGKVLTLPMGFYISQLYLRNAGTTRPWNPILWFNGGVISSAYFPPIAPIEKYLGADQTILEGSQVNFPIIKPGRGIILTGGYTEQSMKSAMQQPHARVTLNLIKQNLRTSMEYVIGKKNNEATRTSVKGMIDAFLEQIRAGEGLNNFQTVCDISNNPGQVQDNNELRIDLFLQIPGMIRRIIITATVLSNDIQLSESSA